MDELKELLNLIIEVANKDINNDEKHNLLSDLWTKYYLLASKLNIQLDEEYDISLLVENASFILKQDFVKKYISNEMLDKSIKKIKENQALSEDEVINILNWCVGNTKENLSIILNQLGKNVESDTLSSFCEVAQAISIMPLENIGISVTKNKAKTCFNYPYNHAFGTATFDILINGKVVKKTYLIDITYRQFFTTLKCNLGMYYKKDSIAPDPGYFADVDFAKNLLMNGYIELTKETAKLYGLPFYRSGLGLNDNIENIDFYNNIINDKSGYSANNVDLEGFNLEFPNYKSRN